MKPIVQFFMTVLFVMAIGFFISAALFSQTPVDTSGHRGRGFIDKNGNGLNDRIRDADGDGIPNRKDPDFVPPGQNRQNRFFIDENGDGINDLRQDFDNDGIVNMKDRDYLQNHAGQGKPRMGFIDANGDGIRNWKDPDWIRSDGRGRGPRGPGQQGGGPGPGPKK